MAVKPTHFPPLFLLPLPFLQPGWFLMVEGDKRFKLTGKDEEFSDELRDDSKVRGDGEKRREMGEVGRGRGRRGRGRRRGGEMERSGNKKGEGDPNQWGGVRRGRSRRIPISEVVSPPYTNCVCVGMEVSCKQS